jgi:hypothetical protein
MDRSGVENVIGIRGAELAWRSLDEGYDPAETTTVLWIRMASTVWLSSEGLASIPFDPNKRDFEFIVGTRSYHCHQFVCDFLSPKLSRIHHCNETHNYYYIETDDQNHQFGDFLALGYGKPLIVNLHSVDFFSRLAVELENTELCHLVLQSLNTLDGTFINMFTLFRQKRNFGIDRTREAHFLSSHFFDFMSHEQLFNQLDYSDLYELLSDDSLKIPNENWLFDVIVNHSHSDADKLSLLEFVEFRFLSMSSLRTFIDQVEAFDSSLPGGVLHQIWNRLLAYSDSPSIPDQMDRYHGQHFPYVAWSPLKGIIAGFTQSCHGNVHDRGIIEITSKSVHSGKYAAKFAADLENVETGFGSVDSGDQWLRYDFKDRQVGLTGYTIRSWFRGWSRDINLISWVIEGSTDGLVWTELDRHTNSPVLRERQTGCFTVSAGGTYRFIQLRQTGPNERHSDYLVVSAFELFGLVHE